MAGLLGLAAMGCASSKGDAKDPGPPAPTEDAGGGGGGDASPGTDGGTAELPKPVLCPEATPFSPKNANSVRIDDVVLKEDATWTADKVYLIGDDFKIEGHKLTVEAGTTICLYQRGKIFVGQGVDPGEIHLNGTAEKPIVITSAPSNQDPTKPDTFHGGIQFDTYQGSTISHVNIWYGGRGGGSSSPAFELTAPSHGTPDPKKPLLVDHVTIGAVQSRAIRIATDLGIADGSAIQFTGYADRDPTSSPAFEAAVEIEIESVKSFAKAFNMTGATIPAASKEAKLRIGQSEGKIQTSTELVDFGLPFVSRNQLVTQISGLQDDPVGPTLTIREGVTWKLDGGLIIGGTSGTAFGNLVIEGTAAKPVTLTSTSDTPAAGDWEGLYFVTSFYDPAKTKLDHVNILYAGIDGTNGQQVNRSVSRCGGGNGVGAVMITAGLGQYDGPNISNTKIAHSLSDGIVSGSAQTGNSYLKTSYARPDITFEDIKGAQLNTAPCP